MIFSHTEMRELGSGITYNTHNTTSLVRTLKYVPDILQTEEALTVKEYTHTHTHTHVSIKKIREVFPEISSNNFEFTKATEQSVKNEILKLNTKKS